MDRRHDITPAVAVSATNAGSTPILEMRSIGKRFDATQALDDVSLALYPGEVHALLGENGAGKSTLIKIITGVHQPDRGEILLAGKPVTVRSAAEAQRLGVAAIYQEPLLFPDLNVAENIFVSHQDRGEFVGWRRMFREAEAILAELGVSIDVASPARGLTLAAQQSVEIAKAISLNVRVLIMDEPTASLSAHEVGQLFKLVRDLRSKGVAILFVSHRMEEVFEIADKVTVFRDGRLISTKPSAVVTPRSAIADAITLNGKTVTINSPREGVGLGIAYVSEDRRQFGLSLPMSISANISLPVLVARYLNRFGLIRTSLEKTTAEAFRSRLAIRTPSVDLAVVKLSGGNQQKVMLSKWLNTRPSVLILDEPTRGIDVGAKAEVHAMIGELAAEGIGIIMISSDLPEVLAMSDRVLVMREGHQMAIFERADANQESVMMAAMGQGASRITERELT